MNVWTVSVICQRSEKDQKRPWPHFLLTNLVEFTLDANLNELRVSLIWEELGEMFTNINVFESPVSEYCSRYVSFEFLNGICLLVLSGWPKAWITSPKQLKDLFIFCVSLNLSPTTWETFILSEPAKSTRFSVPYECAPVFAFDRSTGYKCGCF